MRELSTELQSAWIERVFAKFAALYGRTFADLWNGVPPEAVKAEWREDLAPFAGSQIAWAIEACKRECDVAPTLPRFLKLCQQAPRPEGAPALPGPKGQMSPEVKARIDGVLNRKRQTLDERAGWAIENLRRVASGIQTEPMVEQFSVEALFNLDAMHLAPAEYVALQRPAWLRFVETKPTA